MNIDTLKKLFEDFCNKNQQGGYTKYFSEYAEQAQIEVMDMYIGNTLRSQTKGILTNQATIDNFRKLKDSAFVSVNTNGEIDLSTISNYRNFSSLLFPTQKTVLDDVRNFTTKVKMLDDSESWFFEEDSMYKPSFRYPIAKIVNNTIEVKPKNVQTVLLTYYRTPKKPIWGSTLSATYVEVENGVENLSVSPGDISASLSGGLTIRVLEVNNGFVEKIEVVNKGTGFTSPSFLINSVTVSGGNIGSVRVTTRPFYDSATSEELEIGESLHMEVLKIMLGYCGIKIRDIELYEASKQEQARI